MLAAVERKRGREVAELRGELEEAKWAGKERSEQVSKAVETAEGVWICE